MQKTLRGFFLLMLLSLVAHQAWSQCTNTSAFATVNAPTNNTVLTISTCTFAGEYNTINNAVAGTTYQFTGSGGAGNYLTVRQGSSNGAVLAFGFSPVNATCTVSGPLYLHVNTNAACGTESVCHTTTVQCTSCAGPTNDACSGAIPIACGQTISATTAGANADAVATCVTTLNSAPGVWYSFTGDGGSTTLSLCGSSYDTKIGVFSGTCAALACVTGNDDFCGLQSQVTFTTTAGTNYFVLVTGFSSNSGAFTLARTCTPPDPCASITTLACATPVTASSQGTGAWSPGSCGFSTPGIERLYSFTPGTSGTHTLQITGANSLYADYFYKAASGGCNNTGWTCIGDANGPESNNFGPLTAGTTYYILFDPENSASTVTHTFQINCPAGAPACIASPTSPTNGQTNICPSSTQALSWPASASATSYDVYFGTTNPPPFLANTASTTFTANTPTSGTYFWQILPRNAGGAATGCNVWSFSKVDVQAPTITCPASVTANNSPATACSAVVTYGSISASDNCAPPSITLISGLPSGSVYPVGVNVIVYRAADPSGNTATCSFTVTVKDVTPPTITCPANVVKNNDPGLCSAVATYGAVSASDNCAAPTITRISGLASGSIFPVGVNTVVFRATDPSSNSSTCSFTVTIKDVEPPVVTCPGPLTLPNDAGQCGRAVNWVGQATFTDNCGAITNQNNSPGYFDVGAHIVTHTVTDVNGNSTSCSQLVTIYDQEYPAVTCPANIVVKTNENDCVATVDFAAKVQDNCPGVSVSYSQDPMSNFDIGYSIVSAYATDASGNESSCNFQIRVDSREEICNGSDDDCDGLTDEAEAWAKVAKLLAGDGGAQDQYGVDVDIDGGYAIVGSNQKSGGQTLGAAYVLRRGANGWEQHVKLEAPGVDPGDQYGISVAISNGVAVVGAPLDDDPVGNEGAVYIFYRNPAEDWFFLKKLKAGDPDAADNFGVSVELDGDNLIVGASLDDESGTNAGAAYVFNRNLGGADNWGQVSKLLATTGTDNDNMGVSVAIDGNYAVVGATGVDGLVQNKGAAYVFKNSAGGWNQVAKMSAAQTGQNDNFGVSVAVSGPWALVGANQNDLKGADAGAAFLFNKNQNGIFDSWGLKTVILDFNGAAGDHFGSGVGIDGDYAVISASGDNPFGPGSGRGFVYMRLENNWILVSQLTDATGQANDNLGTAASISGRSIILGAPLDNNGTAADEGSAVIFEGICADDNLQQPSDRNLSATTLDLRCYPVPFSDVLNIELKGVSGKEAQISVYNTLGQEVGNLYQGVAEGDMQFQWRPAAQLMQGVYFLRLNVDGKIISKTVTLAR